MASPDVVAPRVPAMLGLADAFDLSDELDWDGVRICGDRSAGTVADLVIERSVIDGVSFTGTVFPGLRVLDVAFDRCELSGVVLDGARLHRVEFRECRMSGAVLATARIGEARFTNCRLDGSNFRFTIGDGVHFERCSLRGADLSGAKLERAAFSGGDLTDVEFSRVDLAGARLDGSTLEGIKGAIDLKGTVLDSTQVLPVALSILGALGIRIDDATDYGLLSENI